VTAVNRIDGMPPTTAAESFAVLRRRENRRGKWVSHEKLPLRVGGSANETSGQWAIRTPDGDFDARRAARERGIRDKQNG
jgi:hypothetical protein